MSSDLGDGTVVCTPPNLQASIWVDPRICTNCLTNEGDACSGYQLRCQAGAYLPAMPLGRSTPQSCKDCPAGTFQVSTRAHPLATL